MHFPKFAMGLLVLATLPISEPTGVSSTNEPTTATNVDGPACDGEIILDTEQEPPCFADRTCVRAACTYDGIRRAQSYVQIYTGGLDTVFGFLNVSEVSRIQLCGGNVYAPFATLRSECDFLYLNWACQQRTMEYGLKGESATAFANGTTPFNFKERVLLKVSNATDKFYFSRVFIAAAGSGLLGDHFENDNVSSAEIPLSLAALDEKARLWVKTNPKAAELGLFCD